VYGLRVGFFQDERNDPLRSTIAAARHLRDLYLAYNDWYLALAAYNQGSGGLDKALIRSGLADFWSLARKGYLSAETADYVPRVIAVSLMVQSLGASGLA
jgi:membrane-bound lytic murein transglycosylase D